MIHPDDLELYEQMCDEGVRRWLSSIEDPEERRRRAVELADERRAVDLVRATLRALLRDVAGWVWHWGDGEGGWFVDEVQQAALELGLRLRQANLSLPAWGASAREIYERDAYRCRECGDWHDLTIDHIIPRSKGGTNEETNLRVLCRSCNSKKGARMPAGAA